MFTYEDICENFHEILSFLKKDNYERVFNKNEKTIVRREQATGGACMHRGYYCPSLVMDIVLGNINRGRLIKRLKTQKINYTYGFDNLDRLVTVINHTEVGDFFEYIIYEGNIQYGVQYHHYPWSGEEYLYLISKSCYEKDKIKSYEIYYYPEGEKNFSEYQGEFYNYSNHCLKYERIFVFNSIANRPSVQSSCYQFRVENGYIIDFTDNNGNIYPVKVKRRIPE